MAPTPDPTDPRRWQGLLHQIGDPVFVLNGRRKLLYANPAWEALAGVPLSEAKGLVFSLRDTGAPLASLGRALRPPAEVLHGEMAHVRRAPPGRAAGPPWWDVEFVPLAGVDGVRAVIGRVRTVISANPSPNQLIPEAWAGLRQDTAGRHTWSLWESNVPAVRRAVRQSRLAAQTSAPAVLVGEPGTGKRFLARTIHFQGPRRERAVIALDCSCLPADAIRGVILGPLGPDHSNRLGTLILINPHALPRELQQELAERLSGAGETLPQTLATFDADPSALVRDGKLVGELHEALAVLEIHLPPLRDRTDDLPGLAERALRDAAAGLAKSVTGWTAEAWDCMTAHDWPENLRELTDAVHVATGHAAGESITPDDIPWPVRQAPLSEPAPKPAAKFPGLDAMLEQVERRLIAQALKQAKGNKSRAAEWLAVWRPRLINRMKALGLADSAE